MKIKQGVSIQNLKVEMRPVLIAADNIWRSYNKELVITSGQDGVHSAGSLHYYGYAVDLRTHYFTVDEKKAAARFLRLRLAIVDKRYYVREEQTHIHVEWRGAVND
jgi:hypothetical protein